MRLFPAIDIQAGHCVRLRRGVFDEVFRRHVPAESIEEQWDIAGLETQLGSIDRQVNHLLWRQWTGREVVRAPGGAPSLLPSGYFPCLDGHQAGLRELKLGMREKE